VPATPSPRRGPRPLLGTTGLLTLVVILIGLVLVLLGILLDVAESAGAALLAIGGGVVAIGIDTAVRRLTDDEVARSLREMKATLEHPEASRQRQAYADLEEAGVTRLYARRADANPIASWLEMVAEASSIDLMGYTMFDEWLSNDELVACMETAIQRNDARVRMVVLGLDGAENPTPGSGSPGPDLSLEIRLRQPGERKAAKLMGLLIDAHRVLDELRERHRAARFEVREIRHGAYPQALIVKIDSYMFVAPYLASEVGEESFAMEIEGPSPIFKKYLHEFETVWDDENLNQRS
jgi:hypothetical protein